MRNCKTHSLICREEPIVPSRHIQCVKINGYITPRRRVVCISCHKRYNFQNCEYSSYHGFVETKERITPYVCHFCHTELDEKRSILHCSACYNFYCRVISYLKEREIDTDKIITLSFDVEEGKVLNLRISDFHDEEL